jgi:acetyl esterase
VAGDSAGATISTVVCQRGIVDDNPVPDFQLLFYPITDYPGGYDSREEFAEGFFLTDSMMDWFSDRYLRGVDADTETDPELSPIRFDDLGGMPPSMVVTAGFDPLRDEGEAYAQRMKERGVRVVHRSYDRLVHGFVNMGGVVDAAARATADLAEVLRRELRR